MRTVRNTLYERVADKLRERILDGRLAPGDQLGSESALAEELGVGRATVRGALSILESEGRITKQQGARSYVRQVRVQQALANLETLEEVFLAQGLASSTKVLGYVFKPPTGSISDALGLADGAEVLSVRRVHHVQSEPIALVDLAIDAELAADLSRNDVEKHAFYDLLPARVGVRVGRATQTVRAEAAQADVAEALGVAPGTPVLVCERLTFSDRSEPLVHAIFHYRGDRFEFQSNLSYHQRKVSWALPGLTPKSGTTGPFEQGASA